MEIRYPILIIILLIVAGAFFFLVKKKKNKYLTGSKIANTKYIENNEYFKIALKKYNFITLLIEILLIVSILTSILLISRLAKVDSINLEQYNRDIFLCMDVSKSVDELNLDLVETLKNTVSSLDGERFGISIFNTTSVVLVPLTDDYDYINSILDKIKKSIEVYRSNDYTSDNYYIRNYIISGTIEGHEQLGSSLIGDGLASCVYSFSNLEEKRSRLIIFSTDNDLAGKPTLTLKEAAGVSKNKDIKVFGIGTKEMKRNDRDEFINAVNITGGKYYDHQSLSTKEIVNDIESTSKSVLKGKTEIKKIDIPQIPFIILILSTGGFIILNKKVLR